MIHVAFHYRLQTDLCCDKQGCWREFSNELNANTWLDNRCRKTIASPQGRIVMTADEILSWYNDYYCPLAEHSDIDKLKDIPISFVLAVKSYLKWKGIF